MSPSYSLNNQVALKPPMGWSSWRAYGNSPYTGPDSLCLSEETILDVANTLANDGYAKLGYEYVILDDCWQSKNRDADGKLIASRQRFPNGIKVLAEQIHDRNLKIGLFSDLGPQTGQGFPGSEDHFQQDANTFAEWKIDYVKMSACSADPQYLDTAFPEFSDCLCKTKRPMVFATSWPIYKEYNQGCNERPFHSEVNYWLVAAYSNTWRFAGDAHPSWSFILAVMDYYSSIQKTVTPVVKPGAWCDADLLLIGERDVTLDQCRAQFAVWSIIPSPFILSANLKTFTSDQIALIQNEAVIAVHQDSEGLPGRKFGQSLDGEVDIWIRPVSPSTFDGQYSYALAFVNRTEIGAARHFNVKLQALNLNNIFGYHVTDLIPSTTSIFDGTTLMPSSVLTMQINPSGVAFFKAEVIPNQNTKLEYFPPPTIGIVPNGIACDEIVRL